MWIVIAIAFFALLFWSAYSVIREVVYWNGYNKGFAAALSMSISSTLKRKN